MSDLPLHVLAVSPWDPGAGRVSFEMPEGANVAEIVARAFWRRVADGTIPRPIRLGGISRWRAADIERAVAEAEERRGW